MKSLRTLLLLLPLLAVPSYSQVIANASLAADTGGEQAPLVTLGGNGTAVSVGVTSTGMLACTTTYPVITFYVHRNSSNLSLAVITTSNSTSWSTNNVSFNGLLAADQVFAEITTEGSGCSNDVPLGVNFHYIPSAATNICQASPSPCATLVGVLAGANGINAQDDILSFQPNQWFFVAGTSGSGSSGIVVNSPTYCGTSINGMVVGVPDPLAQPSMSALMSGSLPAGTYFVEYSFYDYAGNETLASPELSIVLGSTGGIQVNPPGALPSGVAGMRIYISATSGTETFQGYTNGNAAYHQTTAITSGAQPLSSNTTLCKVVANDAGWPTGTGYTTSLSDQEGNTFPGYPMMWQILGANTTINLSNGVPYYHGVVTFPSPVLASPLNQATQSVNGSLSLGPFTLYAQRAYLGWYGPSGPVAGEADYIAGTLLANVPTGIVATAAPVAAQPLRLVWPSSGPGTDGNALVQTSHDAFGNVFLGWGTGGGGSTGVSYENLFPLFTTGCGSPTQCTDLISTPIPWQYSAALLGPPGPTVPQQNVVQWCTNGIASTGTLSCLLPAVFPGDKILVATRTEFGLGCSETITITDSQANAYTLLDGTNPSCFQDSYATISAGGNLTVTATYNPSSAGYSTVIYAVELSGVGAVDAHAYASTSWPSTFPAITTSHANDTIIAIGESYTTPSVGNYFAGANFGMAGQAGVQSAQGGGPFFESIGGEARNVGSTGTYTPTMTSSVATGDGNAWSVSFQTTALPHAGSYTSRFIRYFDLTAGGDFPAIASQAGNCLGADSTSTILTWITCGASGVTSIQFKNAGTNFGSPMTGTGSMNFVNCTVSGTTPAFTVTCSGAGDTITSPNSTIAIGGTSSNTTLDVVGAVGEILAGATPALTRTPALGTDGSNAGTLQLANGSSSAHTTFGSAATTSNTILGPATVIPTNHIVGCTTSSTTCTLTDLGAVPSGAGSPVFKTETATYTVLGTDFSTPSTGCGKIWVGSGAASTMSVHLPSTTPAAGQCVDIWVYANSIVTIDTAGAQNVEIAGSSSGTKLGQGMGVEISTDGTNYLGQGLVLPSNDGSDTAFGQNTFISSGGGSTYFGQNINASGSGTGANNTYVGKSIGASGSGSSNTAVGYGALPSLSGGSQNTIVGLSGGFSIVGGSNNSCFGYGGCGSISSGTNNALFCGGNSSCDTPGGGTTNYLNIGQQIIGDTSKGILIFKGPTTSIASNACGSSTQGTLATGSNDMAGEVTVGTAAVTSCAVSFANTHNQAPFCTVTSQAGATVVGFGYSISTSTLTVTATSGFSSTKFDYHCFAGSTSNNPTP